MNIRHYLLSGMVFFLSPFFLFAQDSEESADVEEVIVTATKRETSLMETPIAVSVVSQDQLTLQGLSRISDLSAIRNLDTQRPQQCLNFLPEPQ